MVRLGGPVAGSNAHDTLPRYTILKTQTWQLDPETSNLEPESWQLNLPLNPGGADTGPELKACAV
ncbi:hypothetical protein GCM10023149_44820 [Mucilaginibacter gynuensis]|uniref:Uncharacterized protein n=1 Tax=Mucilaginibacter gynuensis TaxID=1302236 RepID=A0ABP8H9D2_9SPHI